jgi:hypothetical protein
LSPNIKFANNKETAALLKKWGARYWNIIFQFTH